MSASGRDVLQGNAVVHMDQLVFTCSTYLNTSELTEVAPGSLRKAINERFVQHLMRLISPYFNRLLQAKAQFPVITENCSTLTRLFIF